MIGRLRHRINFKTPTVTVSATGGSTTAYATALTVWGDVEQLGEKHSNVGNQVKLDEVFRFKVRYSSEVVAVAKVDTVVTYNSKNYRIVSIANEGERDRFITFKAVVQSGGI